MNDPAPNAARQKPYDVAVAGAGIVGLALALGVRRASAPPASVVVCDPAQDRARPAARSRRAVAITAGSRRLLERLGVWSAIEALAAPMSAMELTDAPQGATPPPVFLDFSGEVGPGEPFAHVMFDADLHAALLTACREAGVNFWPHRIMAFTRAADALTLRGSDGATLTTRLLAAADGSRSRLREQAGIPSLVWDYGQSSIVATLAHEHDHEGRAVQHFLPGGPLAILPMRADDGSGRRSSIVWTERQAEADRLVKLDDAAFLAELRTRMGHRLGALRLEDRPSAHPLRLSIARQLIAPRLVLVGDAAHTIHPLAGQGLNLGLKDAAALTERVGTVLRLGLDPGARAVLAGYQQERRADIATMAATTDVINRLFSNASTPLRLLRDFGLGLVDRAPRLKRLLVREAAGVAQAPILRRREGRRERRPGDTDRA